MFNFYEKYNKLREVDICNTTITKNSSKLYLDHEKYPPPVVDPNTKDLITSESKVILEPLITDIAHASYLSGSPIFQMGGQVQNKGRKEF